jgi:hypothetical protein
MSYHDDHECKHQGPHVHPEDFGAVPDGETDCSDAFQRAIHALNGTGQVVLNGTYCVPRTLDMGGWGLGGGPNATMTGAGV